jgi:small nuclear ribonucleoprotein (snRNP)-like protein
MDQKDRLRALLNLQWRVEISDGRIVQGRCVCLDHQRNLILRGTKETRDGKTRSVGMIMVPGDHIVRVDVEDLGI